MKENLIILPGWREKIESFEKVKELLKDKLEVEVLPLPGFQEKLTKPYNFDDYLNYLEEKLNNFESFYLLGHSFGGALAMLYALKNPHKIKKLILYNPAIIREKNLKVRFILLFTKILKPLEKILPQKLAYFFKKIFYRLVVKSYDYFLVDENLKKTLINIYKDLREEAKNLKVKTILIWGENDKVTPLKHGKFLKELIKDSELIIFPGGHSFHNENPELFKEIINKIIYEK